MISTVLGHAEMILKDDATLAVKYLKVPYGAVYWLDKIQTYT